MAGLFLYDTHYQVDKPFAFLDLTLATASPTAHASADTLADRLVSRAGTSPVKTSGGLVPWKANPDQMRYWIGNCHEADLLSRQNSYDYWLINFSWICAFASGREFWGQLKEANSQLARLLLFRWAWLYDAPMLIALSWKMNRLGTCDVGDLVIRMAHHVEDVLADVFAAARDVTADPRERTAYRLKIDEFSRGLRYNTRRHKICTHLGILRDAGLVVGDDAKSLHPGLAHVVDQFATGREAVAEALRPGPLGRGSALFLTLAEQALAVEQAGVSDLTDQDWQVTLAQVKHYWELVQKWDRKFLGIRALAELFLVKNLSVGRPVWSVNSWQKFLTQRARSVPEELTVHVDRFGRVEYLRLSAVT